MFPSKGELLYQQVRSRNAEEIRALHQQANDCQKHLQNAKDMRFSNVVREIESHICLFSGWMREFYSPALLRQLVPNLHGIGIVLESSPSAPPLTDDDIANVGKGPGTCAICLDAPSEAACTPCGHVAGCMSCLNKIKSKKRVCPVCRAKIDQVIKLHRV